MTCPFRNPIQTVKDDKRSSGQYKLLFKDVRAKIFQSIDFLKFLLQSDNELLVSEMQKNLRVTHFVSEIKRVENYPDFKNWRT